MMWLCACPRGASAPAAAVALEAPQTVAVDAGAWVLSQAMLDGYLRYQRVLLAARDAGQGSVAQRARADAAARAACGLLVTDIERIEEPLSAVMAQRAMAKVTASEGALPDLEKLSAGLSPEQRAQAAAAVEGLKRSNEQAQSFAKVRARFGDASVELLLAREAELSANATLLW